MSNTEELSSRYMLLELKLLLKLHCWEKKKATLLGLHEDVPILTWNVLKLSSLLVNNYFKHKSIICFWCHITFMISVTSNHFWWYSQDFTGFHWNFYLLFGLWFVTSPVFSWGQLLIRPDCLQADIFSLLDLS